MRKNAILMAAALTLTATAAMAALTTSHTDAAAGGATADGVLSADEYGTGNVYAYTGGGTGFGGPLGNSTMYMNSDATNLYIGWQPAGNVNNLLVIYLNTNPGGFTDADMADLADGGRSATSDLTRDVNDTYPASLSSAPDYAIVFADFGCVTFQLAAGGDNSLVFQEFSNEAWNSGQDTDFRERAFPLATYGITAGETVEFFAAWCSDTRFNSNESLPASTALNAGSNPGQTGPSAGYDNHHAFVTFNGASVSDWTLMD